MTELRVVVDEEIVERLASEAAERGTSAEDIAAEVLRFHTRPSSRTDRLDFIGIGTARPGFSVREAEEKLEAEGLI
jgi:hypothetical protein